MSLKKLAFNAPLRSTKVVDVYQREKVFTNDKETVELNFTVTDMTAEDLTTATAEVLLYMKDGSFFQVTDVTKTGNVFTYVMSDTQVKHPGLAKTQLVVTISTKKYASQLFEFFINAGLDGVVANEVMIQDWTTLTAEARDFIDQAELDEAQRIANENERIAAENQRINDFSSKADKTYVDDQDAALNAQLADIENVQIPAKANIAQEAWIVPTLLNGWTSSTMAYMKDTLGFVHFKGQLSGGTFGTIAFYLPVGYRPFNNYNGYPTKTGTVNGGIGIRGGANGAVTPSNGNINEFFIDGVTFKAEV